MATIKYDVSNVEGGGDFAHVKPGLYIGEIKEINEKESSSGNGPMLEVILQPTKDAKGKKVVVKDSAGADATPSRVYTYVLLAHEPSAWKLKEFVEAVGLKAKGALDPDKLIGVEVQMQLKSDKDLDGNYRPRVGKLMKLKGEAAAEVEPEEVDAEPEDDAGEDDDALTYADLLEYDRATLKEVNKVNELGIKVLKSMSDDDLRAAIAEALELSPEDDDEEEDADAEPDEDEEEEDAEPESEDDEEEDDDEESDDEEDDEEEDDTPSLADQLADLDRSALKAFKTEHELDFKVLKSMSDDDIREAIIAAMPSDDEGEEVDYTTWSADQLKAELKERGLQVGGAKSVLVARLKKDDEKSDEDPF